MITMLDPHYYDEVMKTSVFIPGCLIVAVFLVVNVIFMNIMVNIKI